MSWENDYKQRLRTSDEVLDEFVRDGASIMSGGMCTADAVLKPLLDRIEAGSYEGIEFYGAWLGDSYDLAHLSCTPKQFIYHVFFASVNERLGRVNPCVRPFPIKYGELGRVMAKLQPDIAMTMVTPPNEHGFVSLGASGLMAACLPHAKLRIAQVNAQMPYCRGAAVELPVSCFDALVERDQPLVYSPRPKASAEDCAIAQLVAERIPNGACIQLGIGGIPNAIGEALRGHKHLGIYSELFSETMLDLMDAGAVDNSRKAGRRGVSEVGFATGSAEFFASLPGRSDVEFLSFAEVCDVNAIARNDNFVSVCSALSIDVTGQVYAESLGPRMYSGTGGQMDFMTAAQRSHGGQSFIAMRSAANTKNGLVSKIVTFAEPGSVVTTPRTCVQNVATEYGCVDLSLCDVSERARRLIGIAHPAFREQLTYEAQRAGYLR